MISDKNVDVADALRILVVEDDPLLGAGLKIGLGQDGWAADWVQDAAAAERALSAGDFDLMVLDLGLPGRDGLEFLRDLRGEGLSLPVLILSARDAVGDRVTGLDAGADDYLVKPFDLDELGARIRALARRGQRNTVLQAGDLALSASESQAMIGKRSICLSPKECALLQALMRDVDTAVSREHLQATAFGPQSDIESNALEVHVHNLRRKLGRQRILTVRGVGYRLVAAPKP